MTEIIKVPTLDELVAESNEKETGLAVLLNQKPPKKWLKVHPFIRLEDDEGRPKPYLYLPRERVEYLLTRIYTKWWVEIKDIKLIANSVVTTVTLYVTNPVTKEIDKQDGVGASPLQTKKGAGAIDFNEMQGSAVQMAAPSSETYAIKDAAEKFGKLFGKDLNVTDIDYTHLLKNESKKEKLSSTDSNTWNMVVDGLQRQLVTVNQLQKKYEISDSDLEKLRQYEF